MDFQLLIYNLGPILVYFYLIFGPYSFLINQRSMIYINICIMDSIQN